MEEAVYDKEISFGTWTILIRVPSANIYSRMNPFVNRVSYQRANILVSVGTAAFLCITISLSCGCKKETDSAQSVNTHSQTADESPAPRYSPTPEFVPGGRTALVPPSNNPVAAQIATTTEPVAPATGAANNTAAQIVTAPAPGVEPRALGWEPTFQMENRATPARTAAANGAARRPHPWRPPPPRSHQK
jgi:hypothetical protein